MRFLFLFIVIAIKNGLCSNYFMTLPLMHAISLSILFDEVPSLIILKFVRSYRGSFQHFTSEFHVVAFKREKKHTYSHLVRKSQLI